jgi:hypothetical protein
VKKNRETLKVCEKSSGGSQWIWGKVRRRGMELRAYCDCFGDPSRRPPSSTDSFEFSEPRPTDTSTTVGFGGYCIKTASTSTFRRFRHLAVLMEYPLAVEKKGGTACQCPPLNQDI